ncbi:beta-galactosidase GalB [Mariniflexile jejuense]|uniref:Beta-galactosidase GalB n=1 Tax=Mariniflexile jejuense TaxID=1173582 RepID=A0ABW3JFH0_9FLAO
MNKTIAFKFFSYLIIFTQVACKTQVKEDTITREKISINEGWKFMKYKSFEDADNLIYDVRPVIENTDDTKEADSKPTEAINVTSTQNILKPYILPTANAFIKDATKHHKRPEGNPGNDFPFVQKNFDDTNWETINLPHDWAIKEPFLEGWDAEVGGGMGRLPSHGVAWYRKKLSIKDTDKNKSIFLDVDGAMSYAMVWLNGTLVGGWPYGYNSWRLNLTPYLNFDGENQIAIRVDNPNHSSRWYPGGGIYRNIWLTKTNKIHVAQWGTFIKTPEITNERATINFTSNIDNDSNTDIEARVVTNIFSINELGKTSKNSVASIPETSVKIKACKNNSVTSQTFINNPKLWGPPPTQTPNLYKAITNVIVNGKIVDAYETTFGIRSIEFNPEKGLVVNGEHIKIQGVNHHHDLGALGAAFNTQAAKRQLDMLKNLGCNAIRLAHNPPAPELLELTDRMGILVINEAFDSWERKKTPHDFHLIFPEWHEADARSFVRRDKNHPSVILWSFGNEVGEQYTDEEGAKIAKTLSGIIKDEDPTRLTTASMNYAKPNMPFPASMDVISLNYQGEGIRNAPEYAHLKGINTPPLYPSFKAAFPKKVIISSETAAALSSRGTYLFPVTQGNSSPISEGFGGIEKEGYVSAYELYTANFGSSADKVFATQDAHPFVAGEFVWSGWDYLGEPTPYYSARSSYFGIIDLAGFKKDRYYLYQSRWRPELPIAHILPHWNWPDRIGKITPVHVFTSGDEAELFLNGKSLGKKKKEAFEYRLRWDDVIYQPGELKVITYKNGKFWAQDIVKTTNEATSLSASADRNSINANGIDLSFITIQVKDNNHLTVPDANNLIEFTIEGPGDIIATDNGDPTDLVAFSATKRKAFNGFALVIVRSKKSATGDIKVTVKSNKLKSASCVITTN